MSYYSPDVDMVLLAPEENMGAMSPFSSCQSPLNIMYSSPHLHQMTNPVATTLPSNGPIYTQPHYRPAMNSPYPPHSPWSSQPMQIPPVSSYSYPPFTSMTAGPAIASDSQLLPQSYAGPRQSRSHSASSSGMGLASSAPPSERTPPRSLSPSSPDLRAYGFPRNNGTWSCAYPGCTSRAVFTRGCDLRKHHKRHSKNFFCRHAECPQATGGGFSSKKDLARHEAKHNPGVLCDWAGCDRVFSRVDNMRDHVKRIHHKASRKSSSAS
ncbi:uncharacterized protein M421DRAFT_420344 [Didymella exigua CBS 183.55]|uniref:C2H2-type domain-containing protein n=1 Tax=Didymella exigua CBS 183.55 TaxID=1150837 RepID=A0A6A5RNW5_9PLEO|nr:uncharacterized protein M421DRAFT_420344 [Didymella exigua CBS 183.55]KAF1929123.1 hypothetical protein M421DRAFT_420344 [Didymella exigua CBS 183.55]